MKICFKALFLSFLLPIIASAENVSDLRDLILIALKNNPSLKAAYGQKEIYKNKSKQIDSSLLPQINLTGGYSRTSPLPSVNATKDSNNSYDLYSLGVDLKVNLYDFDKTKNLSKSYEFLERSSEYDFFSVKSQIITNVTINFFRLLQAKENLTVAVQTRDNLLNHLKMAQQFYLSGMKPKYDITKAEVNLSNAELNIIKAQNSIKIIESELRKSIGVDNISFEINDYEIKINETPSLDNLTEKALIKRAELLSIREKIKSSESTLKATKTNYYPSFSLESSYLRSGNHPEMDRDGWNIGIKFNFPLYNGNLTNYQVNEILANISYLKYTEQVLMQSIKNEIEIAFYNLQESVKKYKISEKILKQAEENYEIAKGRYNAGLSTPIELSDAEIELEKGRLNRISSKYDYLISEALLKKAVGELDE